MYELRNDLYNILLDIQRQGYSYSPQITKKKDSELLNEIELRLKEKHPNIADRLFLDRTAVGDTEALQHLKVRLHQIIESLEPKISIISNNKCIARGNAGDTREDVESMLQTKLGFTPFLQENDPLEDDYEFVLMPHSDMYDELDDDEIEELERLGIADDSTCTKAICELLGIYFKVR